MGMSNAERQRRYVQRLKERAAPEPGPDDDKLRAEVERLLARERHLEAELRAFTGGVAIAKQRQEVAARKAAEAARKAEALAAALTADTPTVEAVLALRAEIERLTRQNKAAQTRIKTLQREAQTLRTSRGFGDQLPPQVAKMVGHFGNANEHERLAAVDKVTSALRAAGLNWSDIAARLKA